MKAKCYICRSNEVSGGKVNISVSIHGAEELQSLWFCPQCMNKFPKSNSLNIISYIKEKKEELEKEKFTCYSCKKIIPVTQYPRSFRFEWIVEHTHSKEEIECSKQINLCPKCAKKLDSDKVMVISDNVLLAQDVEKELGIHILPYYALNTRVVKL